MSALLFQNIAISTKLVGTNLDLNIILIAIYTCQSDNSSVFPKEEDGAKADGNVFGGLFFCMETLRE